MNDQAASTIDESIERQRSRVRRVVTYIAAGFLFFVGTLLICWLEYNNNHDEAKDIFLAILPVSSAIISYWFASRPSSKPDRSSESVN